MEQLSTFSFLDVLGGRRSTLYKMKELSKVTSLVFPILIINMTDGFEFTPFRTSVSTLKDIEGVQYICFTDREIGKALYRVMSTGNLTLRSLAMRMIP